MPRPLTALAVTNAKPDSTRRVAIADGAMPGLRLLVQPSGYKSWVFRYEVDGKQSKMTLGPAAGPGAVALAEARELAGAARKSLSQGIDPAKARKAGQAALREAERQAELEGERRVSETVDALLNRYYSAKEADGMKSLHEVRRLLDKEIRPSWGDRHVGDVTGDDILRLVDGIAARGAGTTANRTLANVKAFFSWCKGRRLVAGNPCEGIEPPKKEVARDRILRDDELRLLLRAVDGLDWPWSFFFRLAVLTGQRREEIAEMRVAELEIVGSDPVWVLPAARTKNGRVHAVPLSPAALMVIRAAMAHPQRPEEAEHLLTTTGKTGVSGFSRAKAAVDASMLAIARADAEKRGANPDKVAVAPWHLHDLRRTAASGMARLGVSVGVVEKVLNHVSGTFAGIVGVYQRHDFADEKREALALWADHVEKLSKAGEADEARQRAA